MAPGPPAGWEIENSIQFKEHLLSTYYGQGDFVGALCLIMCKRYQALLSGNVSYNAVKEVGPDETAH